MYKLFCSTHFQLACFADSQLAWAEEQVASAENTTRVQSLESTQGQLKLIDAELRKLPASQMQSAVGRGLRGRKMRLTNSHNILQKEVEALESRIVLFRQVLSLPPVQKLTRITDHSVAVYFFLECFESSKEDPTKMHAALCGDVNHISLGLICNVQVYTSCNAARFWPDSAMLQGSACICVRVPSIFSPSFCRLPWAPIIKP
jgi:hypothetical protein